MNERTLKSWRAVNIGDVAPTVLRVVGVYATDPATATARHRLVLGPNQACQLEESQDRGVRWAELLTGSYQVVGQALHLQLPATARGRRYAALATLLVKNDSGGAARRLVSPWPDALPDYLARGFDVFQKQPYPQVLRCIKCAFNSQSFLNSLTVGKLYLVLGPAAKEDFLLVINDNCRVRQYPAEEFRHEL